MNTTQPSRHLRTPLAVVAGLLLGWVVEAPAQYLRGYALGTNTTPLVTPEGAEDLNSVLPEPEGGFVAVWDTPLSAIVQRRDRDGVLLWSWVPPQPLPVPSELTRAVYGTRTHTLWCSVKRWYLLENETGAAVREGMWTLPYLDPSAIIIHSEKLHVSYQGSSLIYNPSTGQVEPITYSSVYNTNMEYQTVVTNTSAVGFWHSFGGAWLLDFGQRTNKLLRLGTISPGFVMETPFTVNLPVPASASYASQLGFVDHKVLSADTNAITVLSTVHWPALAETRHYFTTVDRNRNVIARHTFNLKPDRDRRGAHPHRLDRQRAVLQRSDAPAHDLQGGQLRPALLADHHRHGRPLQLPRAERLAAPGVEADPRT
jgi:hypothetical protein